MPLLKTPIYIFIAIPKRPIKKNKYAICFNFLSDVVFKVFIDVVFKETIPKTNAEINKISVNKGNQMLPLYRYLTGNCI